MRLSVILLFLQLWGNVEISSSQNACSKLPDVPHAQVSDQKQQYQEGDLIRFTCEPGYTASGPAMKYMCMSDGWRAVRLGTCYYVTCEAGVMSPHLNVAGLPPANETMKIGHKLQFSCDDQYTMDGSAESECLQTGQWSAAFPTCTAITCTVPEIENGYVPGDIQEYKEHEVFHYECNDRYKRAEERPSKCTKLGIRAEWSPTPACESIKCKLTLPPLEGTTYEPTYRNLFSPGETLTVICGEKFGISTTKDTSAVTTCKEDGEWTIRPVCQEIRCSNQRPRHVYSWQVYWGQRIGLGDTVSYWCRDGYKRTGGAKWATCTRGGWKPDPLCEEIRCDRQDVPNANIITNNKQTYQINEWARYECEEGYRGQFTLTCREDGWRGNPHCQEITCDRREHQNTEIVGDYKYEYKYNDQVEYICKNGYEGSFNMTCKGTGWIGSPVCTKRQCKKLHIDHAYITRNEKETYSNNERVHYVCTHDADKVFTVTCQQSVWTGVQKCAACPTPEVNHGFAVGPYNGTVYYTCDEGYKFSTKGWWAEAKCNDGKWSEFQQCIENEKCGEIPVILNGEVTAPRRQDQSYKITCKAGYTAQISRITCQQGKWQFHGISPREICQHANLCSPPPKVTNAVVVTPYQKKYLSDSTVIYQCRDKYTIIDEDTIRCIDGKWETKDIMCKPYCDKLEDETITFSADKERYLDGDVIKYQCFISGVDGNATCVNNKWNKSAECEAPTEEQ